METYKELAHLHVNHKWYDEKDFPSDVEIWHMVDPAI